MCLKTVDSEKETKELLLSKKNNYMYVWKVVKPLYSTKQYYPVYDNLTFEEGENIARDSDSVGLTPITKYKPGFHSFLRKKDALDYQKYINIPRSKPIRFRRIMSKLIRCKVKKSWVTCTGTSNTKWDYVIKPDSVPARTIVSNKIIIPKYKKD